MVSGVSVSVGLTAWAWAGVLFRLLEEFRQTAVGGMGEGLGRVFSALPCSPRSATEDPEKASKRIFWLQKLPPRPLNAEMP